MSAYRAPSLLTRLALALAVLQARNVRAYRRLARYFDKEADALGTANLLAAIHAADVPAPPPDEVSAARRRAFLEQHHNLGS